MFVVYCFNVVVEVDSEASLLGMQYGMDDVVEGFFWMVLPRVLGLLVARGATIYPTDL